MTALLSCTQQDASKFANFANAFLFANKKDSDQNILPNVISTTRVYKFEDGPGPPIKTRAERLRVSAAAARTMLARLLAKLALIDEISYCDYCRF